jgi:thiamine pyrophosphokinase
MPAPKCAKRTFAETVILAAGEFPQKGSLAWEVLSCARRVVCCDSAADEYFKRFKKEPDIVIGDCDSVKRKYRNMVVVESQDTNDLEKAAAYCKSAFAEKCLIVGACGKREDHFIGNVFRAFDLGLEILTDKGRFVPVDDKGIFKTAKGKAFSIFAPDPKTKMTSTGLEWKLDGVKFTNLYCATLNRASSSKVAVTTDRRVYVYQEL